jgi:lysozyme family protein
MATFIAFYPLLNELEGGYQKITSDPGNYNSLGALVGTKYGISARFYENNVLNHPPTEQDMRNITKDEAKSIYEEIFWNANKAYQINNQDMANTIIDMQVNSGRGIRIAQEVLVDEFGKDIAVDGISGPNTINAINSVDPAQFVNEYNYARTQYYLSLGNDEWIDIWLKRVKRFSVRNSGLISVAGLLLLTFVGLSIYKEVI